MTMDPGEIYLNARALASRILDLLEKQLEQRYGNGWTMVYDGLWGRVYPFSRSDYPLEDAVCGLLLDENEAELIRFCKPPVTNQARRQRGPKSRAAPHSPANLRLPVSRHGKP